jgi:hypothetical protein
MKYLFIILMTLLLFSCGESSDSAYDRGFDDGYAVGYDDTCGGGPHIIYGDFDNKNYSSGYSDGHSYGVKDCKDYKKQNE